MSLTESHLRRLARVANARELGFVDLVALADLNPATAFRGAILRGDMQGQNLAGFNFTGAEFRGCDLSGADLSRAVGVTPEMLRTAVTDATTIPPRAHFWTTGRAPAWADDWGQDAYGAWVTFRVPDTEITQRMRWCPPGEFMMGSPDDEPGHHKDESPRHRVSFELGFWVFDTACTEELWFAVMNTPPERPQGLGYPVTRVSWDDTQDFIQRLNAALPGLAIDLPSEARWEYACRAATNTPSSFGKRISKKQVCYESEKPVEVGSLPANDWGLFEMHGNVWEWCLDHWHNDYTGAPENGEAWLEPGGAALRVVRGGAWNYGVRGVRAASRHRNDAAFRLVFVGFRCARVQSDSEAAPLAGRSKPSERSERAATTRERRRGGGT